MGKKIRVSFDEEINQHLENVICELRNMGIKNASKPDALRYIIKMNETSKLKAKRKPRSKKELLFY